MASDGAFFCAQKQVVFGIIVSSQIARLWVDGLFLGQENRDVTNTPQNCSP